MRLLLVCFLFSISTKEALYGKIRMEVLSDTIPMDSDVKNGKLPNGFTYFIRSHRNPIGHVTMLVTVKAGSGDQSKDQIEAAHLVEHMGFAGTENFKNPVDFLQRSGLQMGKDANASTSLSETTYKIQVPSGDRVLFDSCLLLLSDFCQGMLLDRSVVERERSIIVQEIARNAGVVQRMMDQYLPWLVNNATYVVNAGNSGAQEVGVKSLTYEAITRFYEDWYQPASQSLIVVGDINADFVERRVKTLFANLSNSKTIPKQAGFEVQLNNKPRVLIVRDREMADVEIHVYDKRKGTEEKSMHDLEDFAASKIYDQLVSARCTEVNGTDTKKFIDIQHQTIRNGNLGNLDALYTVILVRQESIKEGLKAGFEEIERFRRYGFTERELQIAKQGLVDRRAQRSTITSGDLAQAYQSVFLGRRFNFDLNKRDSIINSLIDKMTLSELNRFVNQWFDGKDRDIIILSSESVTPPSEGEVLKIIEDVRKSNLKTHNSASRRIRSVIATRKIPSERNSDILEKKDRPLVEVTEVVFRNGLKVVLKPIDGKGKVYTHGFRMVGASIYDSLNYPSAINAAEVIQHSGAGNLNGSDLEWFDRQLGVSVTPYVYHNQTGIRASCEGKDVTTMVQLIYEFMVDPVVTEQGYINWRNWKRGEIAASEVSPRQVFLEKISGILGETSVRKEAASVSELDLVRKSDAYSFYRKLFSSPSEFVFVVTGAFEIDEILPVLSQYLGAIRSAKKRDNVHRSLPVCFTPAESTFVIHTGTKIERVSVQTVLEGHKVFSDRDIFDVKILAEAIQICLNRRLREIEAGTYGVTAHAVFEGNCDGRYRINVSFDCSPDKVDGLMRALRQEIDFIKKGQINESLIESVKNRLELRCENDLKDSYFWLNYLSGQFREGKDVEAIAGWPQHISLLTKSVFLRDVVPHLSDSIYFEFFLKPEIL
jgi:zinc protease